MLPSLLDVTLDVCVHAHNLPHQCRRQLAATDGFIGCAAADHTRFALNNRTVVLFRDSRVSHYQARERCETEGGDLLAIYSATETDRMVQEFANTTANDFWIGLGPVSGNP